MPRSVRPTTVQPMALRELEVLRITDVTPGMRRITFTGAQLEAHTAPSGVAQREFHSPGFDDDLRLFFAEPGSIHVVLPSVKDGGVSFPKDRRVLSRAYTVRSYDPVRRELDVDFVRHGVGVATTWAYRATPGDRMNVIGPAASYGMPEGTDWWLVVGDDTALPAIARLLDELPEDSRGQVFIEVAEDVHRQDLRELPGVTVTWLSRADARASTASPLLVAVRAAPWWDGQAFAWLAGEQSVVRDLRRHLVEARGLEKSRIDFTGYWKRQDVVALPTDAAVPDPERSEESFETFHELAELLPPLAIRTAAKLGVADAISRGTDTLAGLASTTGADSRALAKFLRYPVAIGLLTHEQERYGLTPVGDWLTDEHVLDHVHHRGVQARRELAFHGLEHAVRTGLPAYEVVTGKDYPSLRRDPGFERTLLENKSQFAAFLAAPLAGAESFESASHVVVHANGATAVADALTSRHPDLRVSVAGLPTAAAWFREDLPRAIPDPSQRARVEVAEHSVFDVTPTADAVLLVHVLGEHPDADAALVLRRAAESLEPGGQVLLVEDTLDPEDPDEHEAEDDLLHLALHGSGLRTPEELLSVIREAGLRVHGTETIGWGTTVRLLTPS